MPHRGLKRKRWRKKQAKRTFLIKTKHYKERERERAERGEEREKERERGREQRERG